MTDTPDPLAAALLEEAAKKSAMLWLTVDGRPPRPAWHVWHDGAIWLVTSRQPEAATEQHVPGLRDAGTALLTLRSKDKGGRLLSWTATVTVADPGDPAHEGAVAALLAARLNVADQAGRPARWARECDLVRLTPVPGGPDFAAGAETGSATEAGSGAARPIGSPAVTRRPVSRTRPPGSGAR